MLGVIVNTFTVILGSSIGMLFKKGLNEKITNAVMIALGACTLYIGIDGLKNGSNPLITIIAAVLGVIAGTLIDIDKQINRLGDFFKNKLKKTGNNFTEGFVSGSLLFCVGAMTITGSLASGISGDNSVIFAKSLMDLVSSMMLASALGVGVMVSSVFVFVFQGSLVLLATYIGPYLNADVIGEITCIGSIIIILLGFNLIGIGKFKVANFLPAILISPAIYYIFTLL